MNLVDLLRADLKAAQRDRLVLVDELQTVLPAAGDSARTDAWRDVVRRLDAAEAEVVALAKSFVTHAYKEPPR